MRIKSSFDVRSQSKCRSHYSLCCPFLSALMTERNVLETVLFSFFSSFYFLSALKMIIKEYTSLFTFIYNRSTYEFHIHFTENSTAHVLGHEYIYWALVRTRFNPRLALAWPRFGLSRAQNILRL